MSDNLKKERHYNNLLLVGMLKDIITSDQGEQRFSQILRNFGFVSQKEAYTGVDLQTFMPKSELIWQDEFNLEPIKLVDRVMETYVKVNNVKYR